MITPNPNQPGKGNHLSRLMKTPERSHKFSPAVLDPSKGFGIQRVYTEDGTLDETMAVSDGDVVLVPRGHHPCGAPYGFDMYYLNVMAGPLRKWRFQADPAVQWIMDRDG